MRDEEGRGTLHRPIVEVRPGEGNGGAEEETEQAGPGVNTGEAGPGEDPWESGSGENTGDARATLE